VIRKKEKPGLIFVISGPSGSGKTTLARQILTDKTLNRKIRKSTSFTTRPKRSGERDKRDYFFVSESAFRRQLQQKKILEWTSYLGYYYGTPKSSVDRQIKQGRHLLLCIDLRGAKNLRRLYPKAAVTIFVLPPSLDELRKRIRKRCSKTKESEVCKRMQLAKKEMRQAGSFDYCLINKDLKTTVQQLKQIILNRVNN
jgi:guanylate kinase